MSDAGEGSQESAKAKLDAIALAEAEAAEAEAVAAAARARARAIRLRQEAEATKEVTAPDSDEPDGATAVVEPETTESAASTDSAATSPPRPRAPGLGTLSGLGGSLAVAAIVAILVLLGGSGWMLWQHRSAHAERQRAADYVAAARQGVVNLTSLDFKNAKADVQRVLDNATGEFKDEFQSRAEDFASVVKDSKAVTQGSIGGAAIESTTRDSAVVLVMANERVTNVAGAKDDPRAFRFRVTVVRDDGQLKISKVEYII